MLCGNEKVPSASPSKIGFASFVDKLAMLAVGVILARVGSHIFTEYIKPKPILVNIQVFDDSDAHKPGGLFNHGNTGIQFSTGVLNVFWKKQT